MSRRPLYASIALVFAATAAYGVVYLSHTHGTFLYALDDAYIGFATAKNLSEHGLWGVTRYEFSGASTSLLWTVLLAGVERLIGLREATPLLLNAASGAALQVIAYESLAPHVAGQWTRGMAAFAIAAGATLPALAFIGMEHSLQCALALIVAFAGARLCAEGEPPHRRRTLAIAAAASALGMATRYDTASVVCAVVAMLAVSARWTAAALIGGSAVVPVALYAGVARQHGWPIVPISILDKWRSPSLDASVQSLAAALKATVEIWTAERAVTALVVLAVVLWFATTRTDTRSREPRLLLAIFVIAAAIHVQFGRLGWPGRYQAYLLALGTAAVASALPLIGRPRGVRRTIVWATAFATLLLVARHVVAVHRLVIAAVGTAYQHEYPQALFLREHPQRGAVMLVDLGMPAFFSDARIVDLGGLGNEDVTRRLRQGGLTPDVMRALAASHDVHSVMDVDASTVPAEWIHVGQWHGPELDVSFFAVDQPSAERLLSDLLAFEPALPPAVVLRPRVRPTP